MRTKIERDNFFPTYEVEDHWDNIPSHDEGEVFWYTDKNGKKHRFHIE